MLTTSYSTSSFPKTDWPGVSLENIETLLRRYRRPLVLFARKLPMARGMDADDLVQGFITEKILERDLLNRADPQRGRFRALLKTSFQHHVIDEIRKARGYGNAVSLEKIQAMIVDACSDEFDVNWVSTQLERAANGVRGECLDKKRPDIWGIFENRILRPIFDNIKPDSHAVLSRKFGLRDADAAANVQVTAIRMFERHLIGIIREYAPHDVQSALNDMFDVMSRQTNPSLYNSH